MNVGIDWNQKFGLILLFLDDHVDVCMNHHI